MIGFDKLGLLPADGLGLRDPTRPIPTGGLGTGLTIIVITDFGIGVLTAKWRFDVLAQGWTLDVISEKWGLEEKPEFWEVGDLFVDLTEVYQGRVWVTGPLQSKYQLGNVTTKWSIGHATDKWDYGPMTVTWEAVENDAGQFEFSLN